MLLIVAYLMNNRGSNPFRYICALSRTGPRKNNFQYFGYIGLFGDVVDSIADRYISEIIPEEYNLKRIKRDGPPHHITLMTRPEIQTALKSMEEKFPDIIKQITSSDNDDKQDGSEMKSELQKLLKIVARNVKADIEPLGLGRIVGQDETENECYFVVLNWPSASKFRDLLGLEPYDFHVTLGFKSGDIHNSSQRKNKSALMSPQPPLQEKPLRLIELDRMSHFLKYLKIGPKHAYSFVSLGWVSPQVFQKGELTLLDLGDIGLDENDKKIVWQWTRNYEANVKIWQEEYERSKNNE